MLAPAPIARTKASDTEDGRSPTPAMPAQMIGVFTRPVKATGRAFYRPYGMPFLVSGFVLWYLTWPVFSSIWAAHALKFLRTQRLPAALTWLELSGDDRPGDRSLDSSPLCAAGAAPPSWPAPTPGRKGAVIMALAPRNDQ